MALLRDYLFPLVIGMEAEEIERNWRTLLYGVHGLAVGPVSSLALAAIDTALRDLRCVRARLPLHQAVGGAHSSRPLSSAGGGWLQLSVDELVAEGVRPGHPVKVATLERCANARPLSTGIRCRRVHAPQPNGSFQFRRSVEVKDGGHIRPPFAFAGIGDWFLQWSGQRPPALGRLIRGDARHVADEI
ncbi:MAG: enolase superfamily enzyme related to L-alanine-DL-glutamate epimerase [Acidimicrobiaceae bacterium]|nr:enolase superfamily enzyme related to L-alanine-DL-glutamate epimerase [Acidimicrobiaceae bacterium]